MKDKTVKSFKSNIEKYFNTLNDREDFLGTKSPHDKGNN